MLDFKGNLEAATGFEPDPNPQNDALGELSPSRSPKKRPPIGPHSGPLPEVSRADITAIRADAAHKFAEGREKYGPVWVGDPRGPVAEVYAEQLDSINYIEEAFERGDLDAGKAHFWLALAVTLAAAARREMGP